MSELKRYEIYTFHDAAGGCWIEHRLNLDASWVKADEAEAALAEKDARIKELEEECERERLRLAACGVAAMSNTERTIENRRLPEDNPYYSASYSDVVRMVEREISQRDRIKELEAQVEKMKCCDNCSVHIGWPSHCPQFKGCGSNMTYQKWEDK